MIGDTHHEPCTTHILCGQQSTPLHIHNGLPLPLTPHLSCIYYNLPTTATVRYIPPAATSLMTTLLWSSVAKSMHALITNQPQWPRDAMQIPMMMTICQLWKYLQGSYWVVPIGTSSGYPINWICILIISVFPKTIVYHKVHWVSCDSYESLAALMIHDPCTAAFGHSLLNPPTYPQPRQSPIEAQADGDSSVIM